MWYETLPSAVLIVVGLAFPGFALYGMHYLVLGNHYRRSLLERWDRHTYQRDMRLTGNPYNVYGLEQLCDDDDDNKAEE